MPSRDSLLAKQNRIAEMEARYSAQSNNTLAVVGSKYSGSPKCSLGDPVGTNSTTMHATKFRAGAHNRTYNVSVLVSCLFINKLCCCRRHAGHQCIRHSARTSGASARVQG